MNVTISATTLRRAASIKDQIEKLQSQLSAVLGGSAPRRGRKRGRKAKAAAIKNAGVAKKRSRTKPKKRKMSPEARARIVAAVKARWARQKAGK